MRIDQQTHNSLFICCLMYPFDSKSLRQSTPSKVVAMMLFISWRVVRRSRLLCLKLALTTRGTQTLLGLSFLDVRDLQSN